MATRSQSRSLQRERDRAGCISGLISIFDFLHGRSTKRLLTDSRQVRKQAVGAGNSSKETSIPGPTEKCESKVDGEESKMPMADIAKTSVKELMEEEMISETNDSEPGLEQSNSDYRNHPKKHKKKRNRSRIKSADVELFELNAAELYNQVPEKRPLDDLNLEKIMEELAEISQRNDIQSDEAVTVVEEKLVAAVKLFTEQRLSSSTRFGEDGARCGPKELMDSQQTLSSNKELLLTLLQDPNSKLVKCVQNLEDAHVEEKTVNVKFDESNGRKNRNFFRRRSKSLESYPLGGEKESEPSNKIVILKPGPVGVRSPGSTSMNSSLSLQSPNIDDKVRNERSSSQFSFNGIKRKLKHAMGKERQGVSSDLKYPPKRQNGNDGEKGSTGENIGWSSPNWSHKFTERFFMSSPSFKKGEPIGKLKDVRVSNIYIEAKKHLSEMLKSGNENPELVNGQLSKSLGRILSLPEYNGSPSCSPRKFGDDVFVTAQTRLSLRGVVKNDLSGLLQESQSNLPSPRRQNLVSQLGISSSNSEEKVSSLDTNSNIGLENEQEYHEVQTSPFIVEEVEEMIESRPREEEKIISSSSKSFNLICGGIEEKEVAGEVDNTEFASPFLEESSFNSPSFGEDQTLPSPVSPSHRPVGSQVEDSDCTIDKTERPSPISVLEPLFTDDDVSPARTVSHPVEREIQPRHLHFEEQSSAYDQGICTRISLEDEESAFEYVEAVLLGSGLNWDEFLLRWISMYEILDSSLFDEVELFSSRSRHDQKLLFDCSNEALQEVCDAQFACFTGISRVKRAPPKGMDLIQEIWQRVERRLFQSTQPHSLDQLVGTDFESSGKWMNLQSEFELIVFEMEEIIFVELVEEIVLNIEECEFSVIAK